MEICTMAGVDDSTDPLDLWKLSERYPFVEWGVLYNAGTQGAGRYPSFFWIEKLADELRRSSVTNRPRFALHICGTAITDFLQGTGHVSLIAKYFERIQINLSPAYMPAERIQPMLERNLKTTIITRHSPANAHLGLLLKPYRNHAVLFDKCNADDARWNTWPQQRYGVPCGYAGRLGPDNLLCELPYIRDSAGTDDFWICMDNTLRNTDGRFDLDRVAAALAVAEEAISNPQDLPETSEYRDKWLSGPKFRTY